MPSFFSPPGWMFSASLIPQIKSNYDRYIAFSYQEQELKATFTGLTGFGFEYASLTGSGCSSLLTRGPHTLRDTMEHVSSLLRHFWAMLDIFFRASSWLFLFPPSSSQLLKSLSEQSIHLAIPRTYFSSCCTAFLKLAAVETGHKEVTHVRMF